MMLSRTPVVLLSAAALVACAGNPSDPVTSFQSMCDVSFEVGKIVQVSGVFAGDRYHYSHFYDEACRGNLWEADYAAFRSQYEDVLELGNAIDIGPGYRQFRIEVEGRLYTNDEGKPGIEFLKLGRIVERLKEPEWPKESQ